MFFYTQNPILSSSWHQPMIAHDSKHPNLLEVKILLAFIFVLSWWQDSLLLLWLRVATRALTARTGTSSSKPFERAGVFVLSKASERIGVFAFPRPSAWGTVFGTLQLIKDTLQSITQRRVMTHVPKVDQWTIGQTLWQEKYYSLKACEHYLCEAFSNHYFGNDRLVTTGVGINKTYILTFMTLKAAYHDHMNNSICGHPSLKFNSK